MDELCGMGCDQMKKQIKDIINELRMLIADYFLLLSLKLYPKGAERYSLCEHLQAHFESVLGKENTLFNCPSFSTSGLVCCFSSHNEIYDKTAERCGGVACRINKPLRSLERKRNELT
jgi:hypothetical protein